jgi:hypothetical protein
MDEEQRIRSEQYARNFGAKELLRLGCALMTLLIGGVALGFAFNNAGIMIIFTTLFFGITWFAPFWQPAYTIVHKIMGNRELPSTLPTLPKSQRKWWYYIPIAIQVIILLAILRFGLQLLFQ